MTPRTSLLVLALAACDRPDAIVICHNANCAEPADPEHDDTIDAMRESLALELDGKPVIDGIEVDTFWRGADDVCLYAHDLDNDLTPAIEPANELAAHFARPGPITFGDVPFHVFIELKSHVSADKTDVHTPAQLALHAQCAWQLYGVIAGAAVANDREVVVVFGAFNPDLERAVLAAQPASVPVPFTLEAIQGIPEPLDNQTHSLEDYRGLPITLVEFHAQWILDAQYETMQSLGLDMGVFMFSATAETFAVIEQYAPKYIVTSEARLMRRWLER
ncbi:MAG: hypothetical protein ABI867_10365 [Kofleriaceae bacterium]